MNIRKKIRKLKMKKKRLINIKKIFLTKWIKLKIMKIK